VVWLFDSALCLWAVTALTKIPIATPGPGFTIAWSQNQQTDLWIEYGGSATVQGLGEVATLTSASVLSHLVAKLETLSWGLATQYRTILVDLIRGSNE
jgi:hypothetical protein